MVGEFLCLSESQIICRQYTFDHNVFFFPAGNYDNTHTPCRASICIAAFSPRTQYLMSDPANCTKIFSDYFILKCRRQASPFVRRSAQRQSLLLVRLRSCRFFRLRSCLRSCLPNNFYPYCVPSGTRFIGQAVFYP